MPPRVLIADDSALLRDALRGLFLDIGEYEIIEAETGTEAVARAEESAPNIIILDFAMPAMDGISATRVLRKRLPEIPILMYTMHYTHQLSVDAHSAGVNKLITKSDPNDLVVAVQELLSSAAAAPKPAAVAVISPRVEDAGLEIPPARTGT
jgi:two-component system, NarL family, invasion response regulator UvrY